MRIGLKGKKVFLSGPITGIEDGNSKAFEDAEKAVRRAGAWHVYNPRKVLAHGVAAGWTHGSYMLRTLGELTYSKAALGIVPFYDVVVMLEGWRASEGAMLEREVALACGIQVAEIGEVAV